MHVAVVLSLSLNHAEDSAGDTAETNTPPIPFNIAQIYIVLETIVSSVENVRKLDPNNINPKTGMDHSLFIVNLTKDLPNKYLQE